MTDRLLRWIPTEAWFAIAGFALVPIVLVRGSSAAAHAGLLLAVSALLVVGAWVRRFVLRLEDETPAPAHAVVLGQIALLLWFYARSTLSRATGAPGVFGPELLLLAAAAGLHLFLRGKPVAQGRPFAYLAVWLAFWASTLTFLGYRSGRLDTPSSDPDLHALWARLTAEHGRIIYDLLPQNPAALSYPSGFSALNAVWVELSRCSAVTIVNCQIALQACLMVALVLELVFALRRDAAPGVTLSLVVLAHVVFCFPVNAVMAHFEGTARLGQTALALLPITLAVRTGPRRTLAPLVWVGGFCFAWAVVVNPAHAFVELPFLIFAVALCLPARGRGGLLTAVAGAAAIAALLWLEDAWLGPLLRGASHGPESSAAAARLPALRWRDAVGQALTATRSTALFGAIPFVCAPGPSCPEAARGLGWILALPLVASSVALQVRRRALPATRTVLTLAASIWVAAFLGRFVPALLAGAPGREGFLLRGYTDAGLNSATAFLFFALLAAALALLSSVSREWWRELIAPAACAAACVALIAHQPALVAAVSEAYAHHVRGAPGSATGDLRPEDVRLARAAAKLVGPGEKVLLPGLVQEMNPWELWYFTMGGARAIPLYTDVPYAFFHTGSPYGPAPFEYRDHVCQRLDLQWLSANHIVWLFDSAEAMSKSCVAGWSEARAQHFDLALRDGATSLWRLRH